MIDNELLAQRARIAAGAGSGPYSLSEIQAAMLVAQLPWLKQLNEVCNLFFSELQSALDEVADVVCAQEERRANALYQMGFQLRVTEENTVQKLITALREPYSLRGDGGELQLPFGHGFAGFHRRSSRRCRLPVTLENAASAASRTITLHHGIALEATLSPSELAGWIQRCLEQVR